MLLSPVRGFFNTFKTMIETVKSIVLQASKIMLNDDFSVKEKGTSSNLVTSNDIAVQAFLKQKLSAFFPSSGFYCEEGDENDLTKDYVWIIDPIDGTTNYAKHISVCCISVALEHEGEIILGVVYNPYQKMMFEAAKGKGAFLNGKPIHPTNIPMKECVLYTAFSAYEKQYSHKAFQFAENVFPFVSDIRRTGSAAFEICSVACGRGDIYLEMKLQVWDYAAASLIIKEAGGEICDLEGNPMEYSHPSFAIAANNKENLDALRKIAYPYFK